MGSGFLNNIDDTWTLFLDRDGVINKRIFGGYVTKPDEFVFNDGVIDSIAFFTTFFNKVIIVTNQQGVGKGLMIESQLSDVHNYMKSVITKNGGKIDAVYYCTDLASKPNNCRKPNINMANKAMADFPKIIPNKCIMVGDSKSDIEFGKNAGMKTVFITNNDNNEEIISLSDFSTYDLLGFKLMIESLNIK